MLLILCLAGIGLPASAMTSISPCPPAAEDEMSQLYINAVRSRGEGGSCDANCEQLYAQMERRACEYAATGVCYSCDPATCAKYGISCGSTGTGPTPPPDDDNSWIVIIGAIAVIGGGLAIGAKKLGSKGKPTSDDKKKKEKEKVRYILQISTERLTVTPDASAHLKVTAWKIVGENPPAPAPEATITLKVPAGNEGLSIQPASGTGSVEASVALVSQVSKSPVMITVTATAGKSSVSAQVTVEIPAEYLMEFF
ncbi:MAG TPA: hypothetical protein HA256_06765 [Methanoregulaceae archaeon]|nr:hypothetical protein [Methanoregulaceae archaeon]